MRFSIRSLLLLILIFGLAFPLWIEMSRVRTNEVVKSSLFREIQTARTLLALGDDAKQLARRRVVEELDHLHASRLRAEKQFAALQSKYGRIEARGPDVLSLRTVPQIRVGDQPEPTVFRVLVPESRAVWLKYAVVEADGGSQYPPKLDQVSETPDESGFEHRGPYEIQLPPGDHLLSCSLGVTVENALPFSFTLDDRTLLATRFESDREPHTGSFHLAAGRQIDYPAGRTLPWLLNVRIRLTSDDAPAENADSVGCFWLSDQSSGFEGFPHVVQP